ncbi:bifunctional DNA primase/polymerase [Alphaproteobacteria bacterium]|nr:bifunctional DNA primase/polymerase [Alphaproteobacteria bacterium]
MSLYLTEMLLINGFWNWRQKMSRNNKTIVAVQRLASFDWPVFTLNPDTKTPLVRGWQNRATSEHSGVVELFKDYPLAAIGLVTGQKSRLVVIDIDERENFSGLQNFKNAGHKLPPTITASTPSGGVHLFFKAPSVEVPNSVSKLLEGVDIRGDGGYVIAPPSVTKWGQYSWTCKYRVYQAGPLPLPEKFYVPIEKKRSFNETGCSQKPLPSRLLDPIPEGSRNDEITKRCGLLLSRYPADDVSKMLNK